MTAADTIDIAAPAVLRGERAPVRAGFIPLVDCAVLVAAAEKGFAAVEGLDLQLIRETSWANIRDRVAIGHFDVAHMLAPLPIASSLGIGHLTVPMAAPFALGLGGNAITVSRSLWQAMADSGAAAAGDPAASGAALARVLAWRARLGLPPPTFGMVFPFSCHNYELRYWLAASGIHPDRDVRLVVIPPPFMVDALRSGQIDGFCVGEPWNSLAVEAGIGAIATTKAAIWRSSPEKVLGLRADWATRNQGRVAALIRALYRAALWCDAPGNRDELAAILAQPAYLDRPAAVLRRALTGRLRLTPESEQVIPDFFLFAAKAATFPWTSHALWLYSQMVRWGQVPHSAAAAETARRTYRPDLYRAALAGLDVPLPSANAKVEGVLRGETPVASPSGKLVLGPDGFFDGESFDPDRLPAYLAGFAIRAETLAPPPAS